MRAIMMLTAAVLLTASVAQASVIVEPTLQTACETAGVDERRSREHCTYQYDGNRHGSASNDCADPSPALEGSARGLVAPVEDPEDNYALHVGADAVGSVHAVRLTPGDAWASTPYAGHRPDVSVWAPLDEDQLLCAFATGERVPAEDGSVTVRFVPEYAGTYTVRVTSGDPAEPEQPRDASGDALTVRCHPMCTGELNTAAGYTLEFG